MASKLIIDSDPGIGDALAVAMALLDPQVDLLAVTAACGSVSGEQATRKSARAWCPCSITALAAVRSRSRPCRIGTGDGPPLAALQGPSGMGDFPIWKSSCISDTTPPS